MQETYQSLVDSPQVLELYKHVLRELTNDPVQNVSELSCRVLAHCMAVE